MFTRKENHSGGRFALPASLIVAALALIGTGCGGSSSGSSSSNGGSSVTAHAGDDQTVTTGSDVFLSGGASGGAFIVEWKWEQLDGPDVTLLEDPQWPSERLFVSPETEAVLEFELTVTNEDGDNDSDTITITVVEPGDITADAGADQTITSGATVTLDASASSTTSGEIESYSWSQSDSSGVDIDLDNPNEVQATFEADTAGEFRFRLVATSSLGESDSTFVHVTVLADLSQAERLLYFIVPDGDSENPVKRLHALDPDQAKPTGIVPVSPAAQDNSRARTDTDKSFFRATGNFRADQQEGTVTWNQYEPDETNLPLGVLESELNGSERTVSAHAVVYNTPDGHLYRVSAGGGEPDARRFSSESDATVVCAAIVLNDYADVENSRIAYQTPREGADDEGDCNRTTWRMARLGDEDTVAPVTLLDEVDYGTFRQEFSLHWAVPVRATSGELEGALTFDGNVLPPGGGTGDIRRHNLQGDISADSPLVQGVDQFQPLGRAGPGRRLVIQHDGLLRIHDRDNDSLDLMESVTQVEPATTRAEQAVAVSERLYIIDVEDGSASSGRLLEVQVLDPSDLRADAFVVDDVWGSPLGTGMVTAASGQLAWAYQQDQDDGDRIIRKADLGSTTGEALVDGEQVFFTFQRHQTPSAPEGWVFYNLFERDNGTTRSTEASAVRITGTGDGTLVMEEAEWVGHTRSGTVLRSGPEAEFLFYFEEVDDTDRFRARPASGDSSVDTVDFSTQPDGGRGPLTGVWAQSHGPETLIGWRRPLTSQGTVYFADPRDADSLVRLTETGTAIPVSFH